MRARKERRPPQVALASVALLVLLACGADPRANPTDEIAPATPSTHASRAAEFPVTVRLPSSLGVVDSGRVDAQGRPIGVRCETCHGAGAQAPMAERSELDAFHTGIELAHGDLRCDACHAPEDRTQLRLADGRNLPFAEVQQLCRQCHGPQYRDYTRGAHGGMRGYWDLSRGPRERNACITCHGAHEPAYPLVLPEPPPRDRFLKSRSASQAAQESSHE